MPKMLSLLTGFLLVVGIMGSTASLPLTTISRAITQISWNTTTAGLLGSRLSVAGTLGQNSHQSKTRAPVHHRKQVHISCRQICLSDYEACKSPGVKRGVRSCKAVYNECVAECPPAQ
jgi:hypothetical protein